MDNKLKAIAARNKRFSFKDLFVVGFLLGGVALSGYSVANASATPAPIENNDDALTAYVDAPVADFAL